MQLTILGRVERKSFSEMHCSVAQCLEVVGEWWSLLIVRDAFLGVTRFDDFQERLGISRNVLNQRLAGLVEAGILVKVPYSEHPPRHDYRLTDKGRDRDDAPVGRQVRRARRPPARADPQGLRPRLRHANDLLELR
jgi:DNA-binding HxlR family transcriptional regulator